MRNRFVAIIAGALGDGGKYVAVIRSGLSTRYGGCFYSAHNYSSDSLPGPAISQVGVGAGSSGASDMVSLPQSEAYTVQALMDALWGWETGLVKYMSRGRYRLLRQRCRLQVVGYKW